MNYGSNLLDVYVAYGLVVKKIKLSEVPAIERIWSCYLIVVARNVYGAYLMNQKSHKDFLY